jgi:hypothetical protein
MEKVRCQEYLTCPEDCGAGKVPHKAVYLGDTKSCTDIHYCSLGNMNVCCVPVEEGDKNMTKIEILKPISPETVYNSQPCITEFQRFIERYIKFYEEITLKEIEWISENEPVWFKWLQYNDFIKVEKLFEPFKLNIHFKTEEQALAFYAVFNYTPNCDMMRDTDFNLSEEIADVLNSIFRNNELRDSGMWEKLRNKIIEWEVK